ncbi:hypothetical protein AB0I28_39155, partial [Phytomonospora sp. NPDC050363]|uniref:hypothetical protein n=1 Tax=Phytomonospora sp. NPDC050363 TaxID=3155642 RepID=UPI0034108DB2
WRAGGLAGWRAGGLAGWRAGGLAGWRAGGLAKSSRRSLVAPPGGEFFAGVQGRAKAVNHRLPGR